MQGQGQIVIGAGQRVNLSGNTTTDNIVLEPGGVLKGTGSLHVTQNLNWTGGTVRGAGTVAIDNGATMTLGGAQDKTLENRTLEIAAGGSGILNGGRLVMVNATVNNSGQFALTGDNRAIVGSAGTNTITNWGSFRKEQSSATDVATVGGRFINEGGTVSDLTGVLYFTGWYEQADPDSVLITNAEVRALDMSITAGTVQGSGYLWIGDGLQVGELYLADATFTGPGIVHVDVGSTLRIDSFDAIVLDQFHVHNWGTARWIAGDINLANGAAIWNHANERRQHIVSSRCR